MLPISSTNPSSLAFFPDQNSPENSSIPKFLFSLFLNLLEQLILETLNFFSKEIFRLKLLTSTDKNDVLEVLSEKDDYKYKKAQTILKKTSSDNIDDSIKYIYKIEKKLVQDRNFSFNFKDIHEEFNKKSKILFSFLKKVINKINIEEKNNKKRPLIKGPFLFNNLSVNEFSLF